MLATFAKNSTIEVIKDPKCLSEFGIQNASSCKQRWVFLILCHHQLDFIKPLLFTLLSASLQIEISYLTFLK